MGLFAQVPNANWVCASLASFCPIISSRHCITPNHRKETIKQDTYSGKMGSPFKWCRLVGYPHSEWNGNRVIPMQSIIKLYKICNFCFWNSRFLFISIQQSFRIMHYNVSHVIANMFAFLLLRDWYNPIQEFLACDSMCHYTWCFNGLESCRTTNKKPWSCSNTTRVMKCRRCLHCTQSSYKNLPTLATNLAYKIYLWCAIASQHIILLHSQNPNITRIQDAQKH